MAKHKKVGSWIKKEAKRQRVIAQAHKLEEREQSRHNQYNDLMEVVEQDPRWKDEPDLAIVQNTKHLVLALASVLSHRYYDLRKKHGRRKSRVLLNLERDRAEGQLRECLAELVLAREGEL
jgi:hypothetical protein